MSRPTASIVLACVLACVSARSASAFRPFDSTDASVAERRQMELELLLPGVGVDSGVGGSFGGLVSQRWSSITVHVNGVLELTHDHRLAGIAGGIVEGPSRWNVRPVAEVVFEQEESGAVSGLVGAIWSVRDNFSLDVGWRIAGSDGDDEHEFRAGFTWTVPLGSAASSRPLMRSAAPLRGM